jgi:hypothetical protein
MAARKKVESLGAPPPALSAVSAMVIGPSSAARRHSGRLRKGEEAFGNLPIAIQSSLADQFARNAKHMRIFVWGIRTSNEQHVSPDV